MARACCRVRVAVAEQQVRNAPAISRTARSAIASCGAPRSGQRGRRAAPASRRTGSPRPVRAASHPRSSGGALPDLRSAGHRQSEHLSEAAVLPLSLSGPGCGPDCGPGSGPGCVPRLHPGCSPDCGPDCGPDCVPGCGPDCGPGCAPGCVPGCVLAASQAASNSSRVACPSANRLATANASRGRQSFGCSRSKIGSTRSAHSTANSRAVRSSHAATRSIARILRATSLRPIDASSCHTYSLSISTRQSASLMCGTRLSAVVACRPFRRAQDAAHVAPAPPRSVRQARSAPIRQRGGTCRAAVTWYPDCQGRLPCSPVVLSKPVS